MDHASGAAGVNRGVMPPSTSSLSTQRARSYLLRLPLFTRLIVFVIVSTWLIGLQSTWDIRQWGALIPSEVSITSAYRINTFPLIHLNFLHTALNLIALTPLLERFESEFGTLTSVSLFLGPLTSIPAVLYIGVEILVLRGNTSVMGASIWVFLLLGVEAIRTFRSNPSLTLGTWQVPTWTMPLIMIVVVAALVPGTSLLGHVCSVLVGYLFGLGYLKFLAPPEKALRWIESRLNLLGRLPHYVSVDQKTYGRFGVLPSNSHASGNSVPMTLAGSNQRLGP